MKTEKKAVSRPAPVKKAAAKRTVADKKVADRKLVSAKAASAKAPASTGAAPLQPDALVLDRLYAVIMDRRTADPARSHSARLLSRGPGKVAQKFGEEAVECLIEAVANNKDALVAESADVLYHLIVMWVSAGVTPDLVWAELHRREGVSGIAEKLARAKPIIGTSKIP